MALIVNVDTPRTRRLMNHLRPFVDALAGLRPLLEAYQDRFNDLGLDVADADAIIVVDDRPELGTVRGSDIHRLRRGTAGLLLMLDSLPPR